MPTVTDIIEGEPEYIWAFPSWRGLCGIPTDIIPHRQSLWSGPRYMYSSRGRRRLITGIIVKIQKDITLTSKLVQVDG